jgi:hypothetical protein
VGSKKGRRAYVILQNGTEESEYFGIRVYHYTVKSESILQGRRHHKRAVMRCCTVSKELGGVPGEHGSLLASARVAMHRAQMSTSVTDSQSAVRDLF